MSKATIDGTISSRWTTQKTKKEKIEFKDNLKIKVNLIT